MGKKTIVEVKVNCVEKRRHPTKHYVYVLEVSWSEGTLTTIYRRYSDFFEFQCELLERFPEESGAKDPATRMIPFLPGKKLLGRSQVRTVAEKRREKIDEYCKALIRLPPKVSEDLFVLEFFEVTQEDITIPKKEKKASAADIKEISDPILLDRYVAIADYEKRKKNECSLTAGQMVEVVDKNQNGWWFVNVDDYSEGWVPATYLEPLYGTEEPLVEVLEPGEEEAYITSAAYVPQHDDEIGFEKGVIVEVFEKGLDGWWKVRYKGKEGMAPAAYLLKYHGQALEAAAPIEVVSSVKEAVHSATSGTSTRDSHKSPATGVASARGAGWDGEAKPQQFAPTFHSLAKPYIDKEPIYAPTPRRYSIKKAPLKKRIPVPAKPSWSPSSPSSPPSSPTDSFEDDMPEPVYEIIQDKVEQVYMTIAEFNAAQVGDGLSFKGGEMVSIITKNPTGWWFVEMGDKEGWVPSSYLEKRPKSELSPTHKSPVSTSPPPILPARNASSNSLDKQPGLRRSSKSSGDLVEKKPAVRKSPSTDNILDVHKGPKVTLSKSISPTSLRKPPPPVRNQSSQPKLLPTSNSSRVSEPTSRKPKSPATKARKIPTPTSEGGKSPSSVRTIRKTSTDDSVKPSKAQPIPAPRKTTISRTVSDMPKASPSRTTLQPGGSRSALELSTHSPRAASSASRARKSIDEADSGHLSELEKALSKRGNVVQESKPSAAQRLPISSRQPAATQLTGSSATTPRRPPPNPPKLTPRTAATLGTKKAPPKRPEPPKAVGAKKAAPPRPSNSPALKKKLTHVTICDYAGSTDGCISFTEGESVEVVEKNDDGWWYIKIGSNEGWAPSTFMEEDKPKPPRPSIGPTKPKATPVPRPRPRIAKAGGNVYRAVSSYEVPPYDTSGVPLTQGRLYEVIERNEGWWYVKDGDREGWAPGSYFEVL